MNDIEKLKTAKEVYLIDGIGIVRKLHVEQVTENHVYAGMHKISIRLLGRRLFLVDPRTVKNK